jgi:hypothetical protein
MFCASKENTEHCSRMWGGGGAIKRERSGSHSRLNCRQRGMRPGTTDFCVGQFPAPSCSWAESSSLFSIQWMWGGTIWLVKICWILLNPGKRWSVSFFIEKDGLPTIEGIYCTVVFVIYYWFSLITAYQRLTARCIHNTTKHGRSVISPQNCLYFR